MFALQAIGWRSAPQFDDATLALHGRYSYVISGNMPRQEGPGAVACAE
jgi:hypothetical protein